MERIRVSDNASLPHRLQAYVSRMDIGDTATLIEIGVKLNVDNQDLQRYADEMLCFPVNKDDNGTIVKGLNNSHLRIKAFDPRVVPRHHCDGCNLLKQKRVGCVIHNPEIAK